jgi:hypothetical protein
MGSTHVRTTLMLKNKGYPRKFVKNTRGVTLKAFGKLNPLLEFKNKRC